MKLLGVTGHPVLHSRSPRIFGRLFELSGADAAYTRVAAPAARDALSVARRLGMSGLNVTSPFKEAMHDLATARDDTASRLGAANTLLIDGDAVLAFNTDPDGMRLALAAGAIVVRGSRVIVLGSGGAALAAGAALVSEGAEVVIAGRTASRAAQAAARLGCVSAPLSALPDLLGGSRGLVSCLPQGVDLVDERMLHAGLWVLDANYRQSSLSAKARGRGCVVLDGTNWLIGQALAAERIFAGEIKAGAAQTEERGGAAAAELARLLAEQGTEPRRPGLALAGMMGAGKSVVGRAVARRLSRDFADADDLIVKQTGHDIRWLFENRSEPEFRRLEAETIARLADGHPRVIALGGGSLNRVATLDHVRRQCRVVWLWASPACLAARLAAGARDRPLLDGANLEPRLASLLDARMRAYVKAADIVVDAERTVEEVADLVAFEVRRIEE